MRHVATTLFGAGFSELCLHATETSNIQQLTSQGEQKVLMVSISLRLAANAGSSNLPLVLLEAVAAVAVDRLRKPKVPKALL